MKLENAMLLMSRYHGATVVSHPPTSNSDMAYARNRDYGASVGACYSHYKTLTKEQQAIHLLAKALFTMDTFPNLKAKHLIDELEKIDGFNEVVFKCLA